MNGARCAAALALTLLALAGCGDEECRGVSRCDLRERDCQRSVMKAVACTRGGDGVDLPVVSVISEDALIERFAAGDGEDPEAQAQAEAKYALWNRGLALLGLAPDGYDVDSARADAAAKVAAAYFQDRKDIVIVDRGMPLDDESAVELFAHEVVHALQDAELDLGAYEARWSTSFDAALATTALIEGEAVHYQILAAVQLAGRSPDELDWEGLYEEWQDETLRDAGRDEAPVALAGARFPYAFGGSFVSRAWRARGRAAIDALFEHPPRTTREIMFPESEEDLEAARTELHDHAVPVLQEPFAEVSSTALGAWIARMFAARLGVPASERLQRAEDLAADVFSVQHDSDRDVVVAAWRLRMRERVATPSWSVPDEGQGSIAVFDDAASGERFLLAAEADLGSELQSLAWRAPAEDDADADAASAAAAVRNATRNIARCEPRAVRDRLLRN